MIVKAATALCKREKVFCQESRSFSSPTNQVAAPPQLIPAITNEILKA